MTTEMVEVNPGTNVPFSLPHVSELDEATPRDARRQSGKLVTLPAYNQIASPPDSPRTDLRSTIPSARGVPPGAPSPSEPTLPPLPDPREPVPAPPGAKHLRRTEAVQLPQRRRRKRRILGLPLGCIWVLAGLCLTFCGGLTFLTVGAVLVFLPLHL